MWSKMKIITFLSIFLSFVTSIQLNRVIESGDIILGGLFPIHKKGKLLTSCGVVNRDRGIQRMEAMLFAIDKINSDPNLLPTIKLGAIVLDTCSNDVYAVNKSLEFIGISIKSSDFECGNGSEPHLKFKSKPIRGVVGASHSEVSSRVAKLLQLFKIPQISYASTSVSLSDKTRYELFARTLPPDVYQALVLIDIVRAFNWSYVSLVLSEGRYGDALMTSFSREAKRHNICIASNEKVPKNASHDHFDSILHNLKRFPNARGVLLFLRSRDVRGLLQAAKASNLTNYFTWIASDGWGHQEALVEGFEREAEGMITIELQTTEVNEFNDYFTSLRPNQTRNPWFREYWEDIFSCKLFANESVDQNSTITACPSDLYIDSSVGYKQEPKVQFVIDAVYSFAFALHKAWVDLCSENEISCQALEELDGESFYINYLLNVSFIDITGNEVKFDGNGDRTAKYNVFNYQKVLNSSLYEYRLVGNWAESGLELDKEQLKFSSESLSIPQSICSQECRPQEIKLTLTGNSCCWVCLVPEQTSNDIGNQSSTNSTLEK